ncbi:MAG TPA: hypothetical protein VKT27_04440 [Candidatus Binataceae bacterium]|nr:hypothetical protein [Candidatus Binataceae bacterium]
MLQRMRKIIGAAADAIGARLTPRLREFRTALAPARASMSARYRKLEPRERVLLQIAGGALALFLLFNLVYLPVQGALGGLGDRIQQRQHDAVEVAHMMRTYQRLRIDLATMRTRTVAASGDFSLFSVVEQALTRAPGKDRIGSITPAEKALPGGMKQYSVDLKLNQLTLGQVVDTLYGLSALNIPVTVSTLHITRRSQDTHTFDVEMTCVALGRNA